MINFRWSSFIRIIGIVGTIKILFTTINNIFLKTLYDNSFHLFYKLIESKLLVYYWYKYYRYKNIENVLFFSRGNFLYSKNKRKTTLKKFLIFREIELSSPKIKKVFLDFRNELTKPERQKFLIFCLLFLDMNLCIQFFPFEF